MFSRRGVLAGAAALPLSRFGRAQSRERGTAFQPTWASLVGGYEVPDWFRDAKFGIWAHWTAQCVPEAGDWYARDMYIQGTRAYDHHLKHYGHPADTGFMQIDHLWTAARWDPGRLLDLYKRAGARYFMALANHHDNFDCFASTHHAWNSTRIGPGRDIVGIWERLARERGLRFAVSNHGAHAWHWFQPAYGYDPVGPRAGERYDAWKLTAADGRGTWWDGLDPQQLYTGRTMPMPDGIRSIADADRWHLDHDRVWDESAPLLNPAFTTKWTLRCRELIDRYRPDMVYFDNQTLPLWQAGLDMTAHLYNESMRWHGGRLEAVVTVKNTPKDFRKGIVDDVERGAHDAIEQYPWQTDTCIGDWHYDRALYERGGYKTARTVVHTLCDVISRNGNLMLNIPLRGDGTIDDKEEAVLDGVASWMGRYGSAIYGTRPWRVAGDGPARVKSGDFSEGGANSSYDARDVRYVRSGAAVHAFVLGWPQDDWATLPSLRRKAGAVEGVTLPGSDAPLRFVQGEDALKVALPAAMRNDIGLALIVRGSRLTST